MVNSLEESFSVLLRAQRCIEFGNTCALLLWDKKLETYWLWIVFCFYCFTWYSQINPLAGKKEDCTMMIDGFFTPGHCVPCKLRVVHLCDTSYIKEALDRWLSWHSNMNNMHHGIMTVKSMKAIVTVMVTVLLRGHSSVASRVFFWKLDTHPLAKANNIGPYTFITLICADPYGAVYPPPIALRSTHLNGPLWLFLWLRFHFTLFVLFPVP